MREGTQKVFTTGLICLAIVLTVAAIMFAAIYSDMHKTPYEECLDTCNYLKSYQELDCIKNCNELVRDIVFDITDSFDNFPWESLCE